MINFSLLTLEKLFYKFRTKCVHVSFPDYTFAFKIDGKLLCEMWGKQVMIWRQTFPCFPASRVSSVLSIFPSSESSIWDFLRRRHGTSQSAATAARHPFPNSSQITSKCFRLWSSESMSSSSSMSTSTSPSLPLTAEPWNQNQTCGHLTFSWKLRKARRNETCIGLTT